MKDSGLIGRLIDEKLPGCDCFYRVLECGNGGGMIRGLIEERLDACRGVVELMLELSIVASLCCCAIANL